MNSPQVQLVLAKLQALFPRALFLVGGSFARGDATENSDIDIYCVAPIYKLLLLRPYIKQILNQSNLPVNCMLVPQWCFNKGWYYINGFDLKDVKHSSPINPSTIIRNCLIFSWYNYLLFRSTNNENFFVKSRQQLSALLRFQVKDFKEISFSVADLNPYSTGITAKNLPETLANLYIKLKPQLGFSWSAFWLYNLQFLRLGKLLNFRFNPAILVIEKLQRTALQSTSSKELKNLKNIIFPVYIICQTK